MTEPIQERFRANLARVRNLVTLYVRVAGDSPGRPSVAEADLLRSAVVQLHACLEDLLRDLAAERLPGSTGANLQRIPLPIGTQRKRRFTLGDLAAYRGRSVDEVVAHAVDTFLKRSTFGNLAKVSLVLGMIALRLPQDRTSKARIAAMMARRHQIGHRMDRNHLSGRGQHQARSISKKTVDDWIEAVETFGGEILAQI